MLFRYKDSLDKKTCSDIVTHISVINAKLFIIVKHSTSFFAKAAENMGEMKSVLKISNNQGYLIIELNVTVQ